MSIDEAARATRRYGVSPDKESDDWHAVDWGEDGHVVISFTDPDEAQAACDRLNLAAMLKALQEAGYVIDPLLFETKETTDA